MITNLRLPFLLIYLVWQTNSLLLFPQSNDYLNGKVINSNTSEPVPFATILLKENNLGVYANAEGDFKIFCNPGFQSDSLIITCIGFNRSAISFKDLSDKEVIKILLIPSIYSLSEVRVVALRKKVASETIIARAIQNIRKNNPQKTYSFVSYYRDYQKKDNDYINLNEAIVETNDKGFDTKSTESKYRLLDFRNNTDFPRMNIPLLYGTFYSQYSDNKNKFIPGATLPDQGGNELFILMVHDAIRNFNTRSFSFINTFSRDFLNNHIFSEIAPVYNNNLLLYKISFNTIPKLAGDTLLVYGDIFIQPKDYSIHKLDYSASYLRNGKEKKEMFNIKVEYGYENTIDSLMYLKYISFNNIFKSIDPTDSIYFRIKKSYLDPGDPSMSTLIFEFNNKINKESATKRDHYRITFGEKKAKIKNIFAGDSIIVVRLEDFNRSKDKKLESRQCKAYLQNIKDVNGRILNERKYIEFYQFRELFVQEYNKPVPVVDSCYMENKPLLQNCISKYLGDKKYWMNSPFAQNNHR